MDYSLLPGGSVGPPSRSTLPYWRRYRALLLLLVFSALGCLGFFAHSSGSTTVLWDKAASVIARPSAAPAQVTSLPPLFIPEKPENVPQPVHHFTPPLFALEQEKVDLLKHYQPHNFPNRHGHTFATLLCTRSTEPDDVYLLATRALVYRFLWHKPTRSPNTPVTVFVAPFIPQWQRDQLSAEGAKVIELPLIEISPKVTNLNSERWKDQFTKLNMWNQTRFTKIAYFDADAFPIKQVDELFKLSEERHCKEELLEGEDKEAAAEICDYTMVGIPIIPWPAVGPNGGMLVLSPNKAMHRRLLRLAPETDKYNSETMEQGMLEWVFGYLGPFPYQQIERAWNAIFPKPEEEGQLNVVHQKLWNKGYAKDGLKWMTDLWDENWEAMNSFYNSEAFLKARKEDGFLLADDAL